MEGLQGSKNSGGLEEEMPTTWAEAAARNCGRAVRMRQQFKAGIENSIHRQYPLVIENVPVRITLEEDRRRVGTYGRDDSKRDLAETARAQTRWSDDCPCDRECHNGEGCEGGYGAGHCGGREETIRAVPQTRTRAMLEAQEGWAHHG